MPYNYISDWINESYLRKRVFDIVVKVLNDHFIDDSWGCPIGIVGKSIPMGVEAHDRYDKEFFMLYLESAKEALERVSKMQL